MQDIILGKCIKMTFLNALREKKGGNKSGSAYGHAPTIMAAFPLVFMKISQTRVDAASSLISMSKNFTHRPHFQSRGGCTVERTQQPEAH